MDTRRGADSGRRHSSVWYQMLWGMRAYGVAITVIWTLCATTLLVVFAIALPGLWLHAALGGAAVVELACSALTFAFLQRLNRAGRFDV